MNSKRNAFFLITLLMTLPTVTFPFCRVHKKQELRLKLGVKKKPRELGIALDVPRVRGFVLNRTLVRLRRRSACCFRWQAKEAGAIN